MTDKETNEVQLFCKNFTQFLKEKAKEVKVEKLKEENGYSFYKLTDKGNVFWQIIPSSEPAPIDGGYYDKEWIEKVKRQKF